MCLIRDNGIGRKRSVEIKERHQMQHKSFATRATEQRIELLNNRSDYRFEIRVIDLHDEEVATGTEIQILISPVKQNA
jgi:two-component system LytT family sensor kinase